MLGLRGLAFALLSVSAFVPSAMARDAAELECARSKIARADNKFVYESVIADQAMAAMQRLHDILEVNLSCLGQGELGPAEGKIVGGYLSNAALYDHLRSEFGKVPNALPVIDDAIARLTPEQTSRFPDKVSDADKDLFHRVAVAAGFGDNESRYRQVLIYMTSQVAMAHYMAAWKNL